MYVYVIDLSHRKCIMRALMGITRADGGMRSVIANAAAGYVGITGRADKYRRRKTWKTSKNWVDGRGEAFSTVYVRNWSGHR